MAGAGRTRASPNEVAKRITNRNRSHDATPSCRDRFRRGSYTPTYVYNTYGSDRQYLVCRYGGDESAANRSPCHRRRGSSRRRPATMWPGRLVLPPAHRSAARRCRAMSKLRRLRRALERTLAIDRPSRAVAGNALVDRAAVSAPTREHHHYGRTQCPSAPRHRS